MFFVDRRDAGRRLAGKLGHLRGEDAVVLGLPRGGVPVAAEVAAALGAPLDVILVRRLGVPFQPELGMGAVGEGGVRIVNDAVLYATGTTDEEFAEAERREAAELARQARCYRGAGARADLRGRTAVVVDDGLATGATARAACVLARAQGAARVVLAVPVAPGGWTAWLGAYADELVCLDTPSDFSAIGRFYRDFRQTTDEQVVACLDAAAGRLAGSVAAGRDSGPVDGSPATAGAEVAVPVGGVLLNGSLAVPDDAAGLVVFVHGSGSSRHSPRHRFVADALNRAGLATLLLDLLTEAEEPDRAKVVDTVLLAERLAAATTWLLGQPRVRALPLGYLGAGSGAGAALWAAAEPGCPAVAVVSCGGRPDLAAPHLVAVTAATLLVVGGADDLVLGLNRKAQLLLGGPSDLAVVPGATHLFAEAGALEQVAGLAVGWFTEHLAGAGVPGTWATP